MSIVQACTNALSGQQQIKGPVGEKGGMVPTWFHGSFQRLFRGLQPIFWTQLVADLQKPQTQARISS
jgi:hypothetical protein